MSWELVSFLIVGAVVVAGFAWYERSRPPAQVVALVAALAALAIAGRIAFAAFPNVKPTTDIVIFAGYALGGAPGFAVGALAALVSNFWFGQGPWTPWQMAGWGLCGILGAFLGLSGRKPGRITLAIVCGAAGILYGALLNFSLMATYGGELSWARFWVLETRAIPFDVAHAVGNVVFALIAGPALIRMLVRFRRRFEWRRPDRVPGDDRPDPGRAPRRLGPSRRAGGVAVLLLALAFITTAAPARAADPEAAEAGAAWLRGAQNADGGWGASPGDDSGTEMTAWAMLGLEAANVNPLDVGRSGRTPVSYLRANVKDLRSPGDLARTIIALTGAGVDPTDFGGRNLLADLRDRRRSNGSWQGWPNSTAFAVIALRAAGSGGTEKSVAWLREVQNEDGGWGDVVGSPSTADGTGAVLQVLTPGSKSSDRGVSYLAKAQRKGGGFPLGSGGVVNTQSTAWAVQGMIAAGRNPEAFKRGGADPIDYLAANQEDDGSFRYSKSSDQTPIWVTGQVVVAIAGDSFPIAAPKRAPRPQSAPSSSGLTGGASPEPLPSAPPPPVESSPPPEVAPPSSSTPGPSASGSSPSTGGGKKGDDSTGSQRADSAPLSIPDEGEAPAGDEVDEGVAGTEGAPVAADAGESDDGDDGRGIAGAAVLGALAGCIVFGLGLLGRKGWMHWRYGL